ncbi:hypothetical protein [Mesorhizobium sp. M1E.F.Ca.ET.063.01.1.1]|uniref:hypothetical protein n=1 Tax=Mesorhizobium sp. M1E.F.Ca.ET.063.01.1.1 TaxID=2496750 RepID=UPI000FCC2912|nr:hypothetical protein [Mesorhizobium sp. M1E.F.Ca.ET.063.01.1.1]RUW85319.1 hypothetical protein EOA29_05495 [Mesorhizobium sp. M1E.F.Ca.ET.063.01.1.1]
MPGMKCVLYRHSLELDFSQTRSRNLIFLERAIISPNDFARIVQLLALGAAGEKALAQIRSAANKANLDKFSASLSNVGRDLATIGRRVALLGAGG